VLASALEQFINSFAGRAVTKVGHSLESCTQSIQTVTMVHPENPNCRVTLIDTPGFDDTRRSDTEILKIIAKWLEETQVDFDHTPLCAGTLILHGRYREEKKLDGIIYLHDITVNRMFGAQRRNFNMFTKLCGNDACKKVVLVTTRWDILGSDTGETRERELSQRYWSDMIRHGSSTMQHDGSQRSAWDITNSVAEGIPLKFIQIQRELVDLQLKLPQTQAAQALRRDLVELLVQQRGSLRAFESDQTAETEEMLNEAREDMQVIVVQIQQLRIPLSMRFKRFFNIR
jgi:hypothetical protein